LFFGIFCQNASRFQKYDTNKKGMKFKHATIIGYLLIITLLVSTVTFSQEIRDSSLIRIELTTSKDSLYLVTTHSGSSFYGKIIERRQNEIILQTKDIGTITIPIRNIRSLEPIKPSSEKRGEYWFPNPNSSRYLFGPSAINLKRKEGYYQNVYLLVNTFNFGITDHFTLGAGFELMSLTVGHPIWLLQSKLATPLTENFHIGCGFFAGVIPDEGDFGILYGVVTYGNEEHNLSLGLGYGFVEDELSDNPIISLSGMTRLTKGIALVTENWFVNNYKIFSYGMRFMGKKITVDFAFLNNHEIFESQKIPIGIPYIDFVVKF